MDKKTKIQIIIAIIICALMFPCVGALHNSMFPEDEISVYDFGEDNK